MDISFCLTIRFVRRPSCTLQVNNGLNYRFGRLVAHVTHWLFTWMAPTSAKMLPLLLHSREWYQAGMISARLSKADSYAAEVAAATVAFKFTYDLLKLILLCQNTPCAVWMGYDSLTAGMQLQGAWQSQARPLEISLLRSLHRIVQVRFGIRISAWHIPSHRGEPGNELVDALAYTAAMEGGTHDLDHFFTYAAQASFVHDLDAFRSILQCHVRAFPHATQYNTSCARVPE